MNGSMSSAGSSFVNRVSVVPFVHSTTLDDDSRWCGYTCRRTMLLDGTQLVEERRVLLGSEHVLSDGVRRRHVVERGEERLGRGDLRGDAVRRVVGVRRHLHGELPAGLQPGPPAAITPG